MANEDLKPRQYKRLGRIAENNPERAERVAERMTTKAERAQKGKEIADRYSSSYKAPQYQYEKMKSDKMPQAQYEKMKNELKTTSYDSINFKNKDIDKFKTKFNQEGLRDTTGKTLTLEEVEAIRKPKP